MSEYTPSLMSGDWWEQQSILIFWTSHASSIRLVIHFGLFRDKDLPEIILRERPASIIDAILNSLVENHELQSIGEKVGEIVQICSPTTPQLEPWSWCPSSFEPSRDEWAVANEIEHQSHFQLSKIAFEDIVRASLGYPAPSVEWFLKQHEAFHDTLLDRLKSQPEEIVKYQNVEKMLKGRSPFAHGSISRCLSIIQSQTSVISQPSLNEFKFVTGPLKIFFREKADFFIDMLKICKIFAVRFRNQYVDVSKVPWHQPMDISYSFMGDFISSTSPSDLARTLTNADKADFGKFTLQDILVRKEHVENLLASWENLFLSVWECCSAMPEMSLTLLDCAKALLHLKNYHSLTAVLYGVRRHYKDIVSSENIYRAACKDRLSDPAEASDFKFVFSGTDNFAAYRDQFDESPGIPFLHPHLHAAQALLGTLAYHQQKE